MSETLESAYREKVLRWVDQVRPGTHQQLNKTDDRYPLFVEILKEVIESAPMCGLEFVGDYDAIQMIDADFSEMVSIDCKKRFWASLPKSWNYSRSYMGR